uniref:Protein-S-isoprenylcysteine O-methyltransferase n=1 Tax=Triatoma dimidiata TaxID=72491 RepID=A0A0V0G8H3_TRIDM
MIVSAGKLSFLCFLASCFNLAVFFLPLFNSHMFELVCENIYYFLFVYFIGTHLIWRLLLTNFLYEVGMRACFLGAIFSWGIFTAVLAPDSYTVFGWYMCVLSFFHYSEFLAISVTNPTTLTIDSYILDHSLDYKIAAATSWVEFFIERWFVPDMKTYRRIAAIGLFLCIGGEILRKLAMYTAGRNFTHTVRSEKGPDQTLVVTGLYSLVRHPSYVGWFYWAVGTQITLLNPLCTVAYALASWKFFNDRIIIEEITLLNFFGYDYMDYQKRVPTGLPLIKGYLLEE